MQQSKLAAMGEMMGAIAHQWRQPITTVGVIMQKLKLARQLGKLDGNMLEKAHYDAMEQINYMSGTIDDFRNFFAPSKSRETFSVAKSMEETLSLLRSQLENNSIDIHCKWMMENLITFSVTQTNSSRYSSTSLIMLKMRYSNERRNTPVPSKPEISRLKFPVGPMMS